MDGNSAIARRQSNTKIVSYAGAAVRARLVGLSSRLSRLSRF